MFITRVLAKTDYNVCKAAKITGLHRNTLSRKMAAYLRERLPGSAIYVLRGGWKAWEDAPHR